MLSHHLPDKKAIGHVLFTSTSIMGAKDESFRSSILAPLAVAKESHKLGVGTALVEQGLKDLKDSGVSLVFVLGDPKYYSRFGFQVAAPHQLKPPYQLPEEYQDAWMLLELQAGALEGMSGGVVKCADALSDEKHWRE